MLAHKLLGSTTAIAVCQLEPGQSVYFDAGTFLWKTPNVVVETRVTRPPAAAAGDSAHRPTSAVEFLSRALDVGKRVLARETLALQYATAVGGSGLITLAGALPGEIRAVELDGDGGWYVAKDALVAAEASVQVDLGVGSSGVGSGETALGYFTGRGTVLLAGAGNLMEIELSRYGGRIECDARRVVAFSGDVGYTVERASIKAHTAISALLGGEGLNVATLEGEGTVILQSMTISGLARALARHARTDGEDRPGPVGGYLSGTFD